MGGCWYGRLEAEYVVAQRDDHERQTGNQVTNDNGIVSLRHETSKR
jgi:hypothetical protein